MGIVKDPEKVLGDAKVLSDKLLAIIKNNIKDYQGEDDMAEVMYYVAHSLGSLYASIVVLFETYCKMFEVDFNREKIISWINKIVEENLNLIINK